MYQKIFSGMKNWIEYKYKSNLQRKNILPNEAKIMENSRWLKINGLPKPVIALS